MYKKHFITIGDFRTEEVRSILALAHKLKALQKDGKKHTLLKGKTMAMLFQKPSNRTRISFEVGMYQLGGKTVNMTAHEVNMGVRETIADVSRVISRYVDAVMIRALYHSDIVEFAKHAGVPVINGLSDLYHPCQAVADIMTVEEKCGTLKGVKICYIGDGNNVCNSLIDICRPLGIELVVSCPKGYEPSGEERRAACTIITDPHKAVAGADVIYTDVWTSMGQEDETRKRLQDFKGYTVSAEIMALAKKEAIFMHCLPAHRGEEVEEEVLESKNSVVFDQAENRLHAQKAILALLLCEQPNI